MRTAQYLSRFHVARPVQSNFTDTRMKGLEYEIDYRFSDSWAIGANYSYVHAADRVTGDAPNLGGGGLPQLAFARLIYQPARKRYWIEGYATFAGRRDRLSTLDLSDRRTGGARSRAIFKTSSVAARVLEE